jgi:PadR family transcriptional regulator PadR
MSHHDPQMLKGVLALLLLSVLSAEDGYGYGIVTRLREAGFTDLAEGTVYPALTRLESAGHLESHLVRSDAGPARKYYRTTLAGRAELQSRSHSWAELVRSVATVLDAAALPGSAVSLPPTTSSTAAPTSQGAPS